MQLMQLVPVVGKEDARSYAEVVGVVNTHILSFASLSPLPLLGGVPCRRASVLGQRAWRARRSS